MISGFTLESQPERHYLPHKIPTISCSHAGNTENGIMNTMLAPRSLKIHAKGALSASGPTSDFAYALCFLQTNSDDILIGFS